MSIRRFEDIEAWQAARKLMNMVYESTAASAFDADRDLRRQLRKAAVSSMSNIAEGFDAGSDAEFQRFLRMAQRSATEVQSELYVALDRSYLDRAAFDPLYDQARQTRRLIGGFIKYLASSASRGPTTKD
jgi:four helix bundle protein